MSTKAAESQTPKTEEEILAEAEQAIAAQQAKIDEIQKVREDRINGYLGKLKDAASKLPHPGKHGISCSDEEPRKFLLIFRGDGVVTVESSAALMAPKKAKATTERKGPTDLFARGFQANDRVCRLVRTDAIARQGGFEDLATVLEATILDSSTMEGKNALGEAIRGLPTGVGRHVAGAGNESGKYEPSLDGILFWFKDPSSYVVRGGKRYEIDKDTGCVLSK